jgi:hypothetical protein
MIVDILQELTDVDTLHESVEGTAALVQSLSDNQVNKEQHNTTVIYGLQFSIVNKQTIFKEGF